VKERPILFKDFLVLKILEGKKTQTRRIINPQPEVEFGLLRLKGAVGFTARHCIPNPASPCPYGMPGDRLWVRETWAPAISGTKRSTDVVYRADADDDSEVERWRPSIHMPRWASRITLELTGVRVEQTQAISHADILAEGFEPLEMEDSGAMVADVRRQFSMAWERINGDDSWQSDPWVWVLEFRRIEAQGAA